MIRFLLSILIQITLLGASVASDKTPDLNRPRLNTNLLLPDVLANCMKDICDNIDELNPERAYLILVEAINVLQENKIQCFMRFLKVTGFKYDSLYYAVTWRNLTFKEPSLSISSKTYFDIKKITEYLSKAEVSKKQTILLLREVINGIIADRILFSQMSRQTPDLWVDQKTYDDAEEVLLEKMTLNYTTLGGALNEFMRKQISTWNDINTLIDDIEKKRVQQLIEPLQCTMSSHCERPNSLFIEPGKEIWKEWVSRYVLKRAWLLQDFIDQGMANNPEAMAKYTELTKAIEGLRSQQTFGGELSDLFVDPFAHVLEPAMDLLMADGVPESSRPAVMKIKVDNSSRAMAGEKVTDAKARLRAKLAKLQEEKKEAATSPQKPATSSKRNKKKKNKKSPAANQSKPVGDPVVAEVTEPTVGNVVAVPAQPADTPPRLAPMEAKKQTPPLLKDAMNLILLPKFNDELKALLVEPAGNLSNEALLERSAKGLVAAISQVREAKEKLFQATMSSLGIEVQLSSEAYYSVTMFTDQERELFAQNKRFKAAFTYNQDDKGLVSMNLCFRNPDGFDMIARTRDAAVGDRFFYDLLTQLLPHMDFKKIDFKGMSADFRMVEKSFLEMYNRFVYMFFPILREDLTQQGLLPVRDTIEKYLMKPPVYYLQCLGEANVGLVPMVQQGFCQYMHALKCIMEQVIDPKFPVVLNPKLEQRLYIVAGKEFIVTPEQLDRMRMDFSRETMLGRLVDRKRTDEIIQWYEERVKKDAEITALIDKTIKQGQEEVSSVDAKYQAQLQEVTQTAAMELKQARENSESLLMLLDKAKIQLIELNAAEVEKQKATHEREMALIQVQQLREELALFKSLEAQRMADIEKRNQHLEEQAHQQAKMIGDLGEQLGKAEGDRDTLLKRAEELSAENDILNDRVTFHQVAATINENAQEALQLEEQRANKLEASLKLTQDENERLKQEGAEQAKNLADVQKQLEEARKQLEEIQSSDGMQVIRNQNMLINGMLQERQLIEQRPELVLKGLYGFRDGVGKIRYMTLEGIFQAMREALSEYLDWDTVKAEANIQNSINDK